MGFANLGLLMCMYIYICDLSYSIHSLPKKEKKRKKREKKKERTRMHYLTNSSKSTLMRYVYVISYQEAII